LHTEALFLKKVVLGEKLRETGHADAIRLEDFRVRDHVCTSLFIKKKKGIHKYLVLEGEEAFKEKETQTELSKE